MNTITKASRALVAGLLVALCAAVPAFAATGSITVSGLGEEETTVSAYQVVEYDSSTGEWTLTELAAAAIDDDDEADALAALTGEESSTTIAAVLSTIADYVSSNSPTADATTTTSTGTATLSTTELGSYLVIATSANYEYTNMLATNYDSETGLADATLVAKGAYKSLEKSVSAYYYAVGDTVSYTVTSNFPAYQGTGNPSLVLTDEMESELSFTGASSISISYTDNSGNAQTLTSASGAFTVSTTVDGDDDFNGFVITFDSEWLAENATAIAGVEYTLTYSATISSFDSDLNYSNTVGATVNGEDWGEDTETVYTAAFQIKKVDDSGSALSGVSFQVTTTISGTTYYVSVSTDGTASLSESAVTLTTDDSGLIVVNGIDPDYTYTITETATVGSYQLTSTSPTLTFDTESATTSETGVTTYSTVTLADNGATDWDISNDGTVTVSLVNYELGALPQTGDNAMIFLIVAGVGLMVGCGGVFIALRKRSQAGK